MTTYCVTFGQRYRLDPHPASPLIHPDGWLEIEADTTADARALAVEALDTAWSGLYPLEDVGAEYYPRGATGFIFRCSLCGKAVINVRWVCPDCVGSLG